MTRGRRPLGPKLVERLEGSPQAKKRLELILRTVCGDMTIPRACQELGIGNTRFHRVRGEILQRMLESLEAKPRGRPPDASSEQDEQLERLQHQVQSLTADLRASQIREQLAIVLPRLAGGVNDAVGGGKKSGRRSSGRKRRGKAPASAH